MNTEDFKEKIKVIIRGVYKISDPDVEPKATDHYLMQKFPSLREVIVNLLTDQYGDFIEDIGWIAPRPTTFKVILKNEEFFYLTYTGKSYIATVEGKKYYLLNIGEDERAAQAIARLLRLGKFGKGGEVVTDEEEIEVEETPPEEVAPAEEPPPEAI